MSSSLPVSCPSCGHAASVPSAFLDRRVKCPRCRQPFTVAGSPPINVEMVPVATQPPPTPPTATPSAAGGFDFDPGEVSNRAERRRHARHFSGQMRLLTGVLVVGALAVIGLLGYRFVYIPKVVKVRELEQRKLYEQYEHVFWMRLNLAPSVRIARPDSDAKDQEAEWEKYRAARKKAEQEQEHDCERRMKELDDESLRRWGKSIHHFSDLPPSDSPYYRD